MGRNSYSNSSFLWNVDIGDNVRIARNVHARGWPDKKIVIADGAFVGYGAFIREGIKIGKGAIIGANAVVTKNVPAGELWAGVPAKFIKKASKNKRFT